MDEILIGEKVYISSKRAAKVTGYAKDYIGQLCREGRVPARLVGRGWYVLESAIQDHRFGNPETKDSGEKITQEATLESISKTWDSPRYEPAEGEMLPSVNRLREEDKEQVAVEEKPPQKLEDSWQVWFDRIGEAAPTSEAPMQPVVAESVREEVHIPIHTIYDLPPQIVMPVAVQEIEENEPAEKEVVQTPQRRRGRRKVIATIQFAGALMALISASLAVIGSGYLDSYIISNSQARILAGVSLYNK